MPQAKLSRREALGAMAAPLLAKDETRPNFLFILVDDLRFDAQGCTGHPFVKTPNIDRIAREGVTFTNAFVTTPLCSPSRASYLTGRYVRSHRVLGNGDNAALSHQLVTWPKLLHDAGYETGYAGKWHMGTDDSPRPGFDRWVSFRGQGVYNDPPLNVDGRPAVTPQAVGSSDELIRNQLRCLTAIDEGVGRILKTLEETGQLDNTLVVFTSDNGYFWGEHHLGDKRWAYEESLRIPMFMRYPRRIKAGSKISQMVMNVDMAPTMLDLVGVTASKEVQGRSILPL